MDKIDHLNKVLELIGTNEESEIFFRMSSLGINEPFIHEQLNSFLEEENKSFFYIRKLLVLLNYFEDCAVSRAELKWVINILKFSYENKEFGVMFDILSYLFNYGEIIEKFSDVENRTFINVFIDFYKSNSYELPSMGDAYLSLEKMIVVLSDLPKEYCDIVLNSIGDHFDDRINESVEECLRC